MSIDIDYALLSDPTSPFAQSLIDALNAALNTQSRPAFLGPVTVTALDFGDAGPDVEIRDVRDVWRAFEEGDDDDDDEDGGGGVGADGEGEGDEWGSGADYGYDGEHEGTTLVDEYDEGGLGRRGPGVGLGVSLAGRARGRRRSGAEGAVERGGRGGAGRPHAGAPSTTGGVGAGAGAGALVLSPPLAGRDDDAASVLSAPQSVRSLRSLRSVQAVGIGLHPSLGSAAGLLAPRAPGLLPGSASQPLSLAALAHAHAHAGAGAGASSLAGGRGGWRDGPAPRTPGAAGRSVSHPLPRPAGARTHTHSRLPPSPPKATASPPPSPPARPAGLPRTEGGLPSVQVHLHLTHAANLRLTLLTSLQVNYPSKLFMALPLKLSVTGLTIDADIVLAYSGARHRLYVSITDDDVAPSARSSVAGLQSPTPSYANGANGGAGGAGGMGRPGGGGAHYAPSYAYNQAAGSGPVPIGQRVIPHLHIESEIGHADAHVLRNVGKVERFIADVLRKTVVDELVWPNFYTVAL